MADKFSLRLNVEIQKRDEQGRTYGSGDRLTVMEDVSFEAESFLQIAHVLGQFHELAEEIRQREQKLDA